MLQAGWNLSLNRGDREGHRNCLYNFKGKRKAGDSAISHHTHAHWFQSEKFPSSIRWAPKYHFSFFFFKRTPTYTKKKKFENQWSKNLHRVPSVEIIPPIMSIKKKKGNRRTSLLAQWLRICLPMQGIWVRSLVWENPTCQGATKPVHHNFWARMPRACALQQEAITKRSLSTATRLTPTRESPHTARKTQHSQK